jgi:hypothetical protein
MRLRAPSSRNLLVKALLLSSLAAAIGIGVVSDAAAIDPPENPRKVKQTPPAKGAPPRPRAIPRGVAPLSKSLPVGDRTIAPKATTLPGGAALPKGAALRDGAGHRPEPNRLAPNAVGPNRLAPNVANRPGPQQPTPNRLAPNRLTPNQLPPNRFGAVQPLPRGLANRPAFSPRIAQFRALPQTLPRERLQFRLQHRQSILLARSLVPYRPLPGERGFTGVPAVDERRYVSNEMVFQVGAGVSQQTVEGVAGRLGLTTVGSQRFDLTGETMFHFRVADGRQVSDVVRALEAENIGYAQPNYTFSLQQDPALAARTQASTPGQYVVNKLRLGDVHRIATGNNVLIAVIDSEIDSAHPDLAGAVVERFDAVGRPGAPHAHGTGMAGAIAAHSRLMGIAPNAKILAIHAFSPDAKETAAATTRNILAGIDWAIQKGARVINMSFAGPYDPMLQLAMKKAHEKGIVLIAAAGNMGPKSPPLYPAADPHVIAVTATDESDQPFAQANQGPHVAIAAPGVNVLEPAPNASYQLTTGTSVAAAHVSGIAALLIERDPSLDPTTVHELLTASARKAAPGGRDEQLGWGLVDPARALSELEAKPAEARTAGSAKPVALPAPAKPGGAPAPAKPSPASTR